MDHKTSLFERIKITQRISIDGHYIRDISCLQRAVPAQDMHLLAARRIAHVTDATRAGGR